MHRKIATLIVFLLVVSTTPIAVDSFSEKQDPIYITPIDEVAVMNSTTAVIEATEEMSTYFYIKSIPLSSELQESIQKACERYGVPYELALAVAECESNFDLDADNGTCWGIMQIHPINYPRLRENGIEPTEYHGNITAGVFMLGELLEKYTDTHKALMAYNCGETGAKRLWNEGCMTSTYSVKVVTLSEKWQKIINSDN